MEGWREKAGTKRTEEAERGRGGEPGERTQDEPGTANRTPNCWGFELAPRPPLNSSTCGAMWGWGAKGLRLRSCSISMK